MIPMSSDIALERAQEAEDRAKVASSPLDKAAWNRLRDRWLKRAAELEAIAKEGRS